MVCLHESDILQSSFDINNMFTYDIVVMFCSKCIVDVTYFCYNQFYEDEGNMVDIHDTNIS